MAMDEAVEGRKVVQGLWDGDVLEQGSEGKGPQKEPIPPRAAACTLGWHRTP